MERILIVSMFPKEETPYASYYIDVIESKKIAYDILYWNRNETKKNDIIGNEIYFNVEAKTGGKKYKKIVRMIRYAQFIRRALKKKNYTKVVVLTTRPGIFLFDRLIRKFKNKYILDIRDYTNEQQFFYAWIEKKLITHSFRTVISSDGFRTFLPQEVDYLNVHNISNQNDWVSFAEDMNHKASILIGFVGNVRYEKENTLLIKKLSRDERFVAGYWGRVTNDFKLNNKTSFDNAVFFGPFINEEKSDIYKKIDIINALYGKDSLEVTTAIPNRFYDALIFKKPIIASKGTYLGEMVQRSGIGLVVDIEKEDIVAPLLDYIAHFDPALFVDRCTRIYEACLKDQATFLANIEDFLDQQ